MSHQTKVNKLEDGINHKTDILFTDQQNTENSDNYLIQWSSSATHSQELTYNRDMNLNLEHESI